MNAWGAQWFALLAGTRQAALVAHAARRSRFYAAHWGGKGGANFSDLPPVSRAQLMEHFDDWVCDPRITLDAVRRFVADPARAGDAYLDRYAVWTSSGTSGLPGIFVHDDFSVGLSGWLTSTRGDPRVLAGNLSAALGSDCRSVLVSALGGHFAAYALWQRQRRMNPWIASRSRAVSVLLPLPQICGALEAAQPQLLASYPSMLVELARERRAGRLEIAPRALWAGGEHLSGAMRAEIESCFGAPLAEEYGASECITIASACAAGRLHVNQDWVTLEPVDAHDRPVPAGTVSHAALLTNLANFVQPVIRYRLEDRILELPGPCPCGNPMMAIRVEGRTDETLALAGARGLVRIVPMALATAVEEEAGVHRFQIRARGPRLIEVRLDPAELGRQAALAARVRQVLARLLESHGARDVRIDCRWAAPQRDARSGKWRQVLGSTPAGTSSRGAGAVGAAQPARRASPRSSSPVTRRKRS
jgi:phenylacetate-coenzyme A ligase PaaK-like adenylate-forming protein